MDSSRLPASLLANICGYLDITLGDLFSIIADETTN